MAAEVNQRTAGFSPTRTLGSVWRRCRSTSSKRVASGDSQRRRHRMPAGVGVEGEQGAVREPGVAAAFDLPAPLVEEFGHGVFEEHGLDVVDDEAAAAGPEADARADHHDKQVRRGEQGPGALFELPALAEGLEVAAQQVAHVRPQERQEQAATEVDEAGQADEEAGEVPRPRDDGRAVAARQRAEPQEVGGEGGQADDAAEAEDHDELDDRQGAALGGGAGRAIPVDRSRLILRRHRPTANSAAKGASSSTYSFLLARGRYSEGNRSRRGAARLARQAHNLEVVGSNPTAATRKPLGNQGFFVFPPLRPFRPFRVLRGPNGMHGRL